MPNPTWGAVTFQCRWGTYRGPRADAGLVDIAILPEPGATTPASVLQDMGRGRRRIRFQGQVSSYANWQTIETKWLARTEAVFTDVDGASRGVYLIEDLSDPECVAPVLWRYNITLVEA